MSAENFVPEAVDKIQRESIKIGKLLTKDGLGLSMNHSVSQH